MPGIVGLITKMPREQAEQKLLRMVESIRHESFYETGTLIDETLGLYVGWAERKNSFASGMPLCNENGRVTLVFSGENYPEPGTVDRLKAKGHQLRAQPASYLIHLYEDDPTFPVALNGRFQGVLIDRDRGTVRLFNDRFGMHRINFHQSQDAFYFATEAKAILEVHPELRKTDPRGLGEFVACGCVMENRTLFQGIHILPPASDWLFRNTELEQKGTYFQPQEWESQTQLDGETYYQQLKEVFSRILPRYFNGHEKISMSLTGGLDSRMIMAWQKFAPNTLPCFSFGSELRDNEDVRLARKVAQMCGQPYEVITVGKEFLSRFAHFAERTVYLSDGCAGVSRCPDLYVNEHAREIAPVRMTGNYGSEILRLLVAFKAGEPTPGLFQPEFLKEVRTAKNTYNQLMQGQHAASFISFRQVPWHHYGLLALEQTQLSLRSPYLDNELVRTAFRAPNSAIAKSDLFANGEDCVRLINDGDAALGRLRTDRGFGGPPGKFSAAISRAILEFTFKAEYAYDYGMPQSVARVDHAFSALHLERLFLGRHKFNHFRIWYRDALSSYVKEMLLDSRTLSRPYINGKTLETMVQGHVKGDHNYTNQIHSILTLELIHRTFLDA